MEDQGGDEACAYEVNTLLLHAEKKKFQNKLSKIRGLKLCEGENYASKYGILFIRTLHHHNVKFFQEKFTIIKKKL